VEIFQGYYKRNNCRQKIKKHKLYIIIIISVVAIGHVIFYLIRGVNIIIINILLKAVFQLTWSLLHSALSFFFPLSIDLSSLILSRCCIRFVPRFSLSYFYLYPWMFNLYAANALTSFSLFIAPSIVTLFSTSEFSIFWIDPFCFMSTFRCWCYFPYFIFSLVIIFDRYLTPYRRSTFSLPLLLIFAVDPFVPITILLAFFAFIFNPCSSQPLCSYFNIFLKIENKNCNKFFVLLL